LVKQIVVNCQDYLCPSKRRIHSLDVVTIVR